MSGYLIIVDPETGERRQVEPSELHGATSQGWRLETDEETRARAVDKEFSGIGDTLKAGAAGVARGLTFGLSDVALTQSGIAKQEDMAALKEVQQAASIGGEVLGAVGGLALGGVGALKGATAGVRAATGIGQAAERATARAVGHLIGDATTQGIARRIAAKAIPKAVGGAVESTFYSTGQLVSEAALGNPEITAERVASHIGMGALIGGGVAGAFGAVPALRKVQETTSKAIVERGETAIAKYADDMATAAKETAEEMTGQPGNVLTRFAEGRALKAAGFIGGDIKKLGYDRARRVGRTMLDYSFDEGSELAGKQIVGVKNSSMESIAQRLHFAKEATGEKLGKLYRSLDQITDVTPDVAAKYKPKMQNALDEIEASLKELDNSGMKTLKNEAKIVRDEIEDYYQRAAAGDTFSFEEMHNIRKNIDRVKVYHHDPIKGATEAGKKFIRARQALENELTRAGDEAAKLTGFKDFIPEYKKLKQTYGDLKAAADVSYDRVGAKMGNRFFSLTDNLAGMAAGAGDMATGSAAPGAILQGLAVGTAYKIARERGSAVLADLANKVGSLAAVERASMATAGRLSKAADAFMSGSTGAAVDAARRAGVRTYSTVSAPSPVPAAVMILNNGLPERKSKEKQDLFGAYEQKREQLDEMMADPQGYVEKLTTKLDGIQHVAPETASQMASLAMRSAQYLHGTMPKPPDVPTLTPQVQGWRPSRAEIERWSRRVRVVNDPMTAVEDLAHGSLTPEAVDALKAVYPQMYAQIQQEIASKAAERTEPIPYQQRVQLSLLFGQPLDQSLSPDFVKWSQELYGQEEKGGTDKPGTVSGHAQQDLSVQGLRDLSISGQMASNSHEIGRRES